MFKKLLAFAAAAIVAVGANAETKVLWQSEDPAGKDSGGWGLIYSMDAADFAENIALGDVLTITIAGTSESSWPQVALFEQNVGWPPVVNAGIGGKEYPCVIEFSMVAEYIDKFSETGMDIKGDGAIVSEVAVVKSDIVVDPNAIWFGHKAMNWGDGISIGKDAFANVKAGDKIQVVTELNENGEMSSFQMLLGGWNGLNIASYQRWGEPYNTFMSVEDNVLTLELVEALADFTREEEVGEGDEKEKVEKNYDAFTLLKEGGLTLQGPTTVTQVLLVPGTTLGVSSIANENAPVEYYNIQGIRVNNPVKGNLYIVKKGNKATKVIL